MKHESFFLPNYVCVFFTLSTRRHPAQPVSVPILLFNPRELRTSSVATKVRQRDTTQLHCYAVSKVDNVMPCHQYTQLSVLNISS